jgi:hypothetical protein
LASDCIVSHPVWSPRLSLVGLARMAGMRANPALRGASPCLELCSECAIPGARLWRDLIRRMSKENLLWGAARIHGELLMLGFEVAQSTVSKYMMRGRRPPSQTWKTFLRNHAEAIAAVDICVVPTLTFDRLFAFLVLGHDRRQLLWFGVTHHPTAEWLAR